LVDEWGIIVAIIDDDGWQGWMMLDEMKNHPLEEERKRRV
jgi:hypothetical protein